MRLRHRIARWLLRDELREVEREIEEEFRFHLDMRTAALIAEGMSPEEARTRARERFGDEARLREDATNGMAELRTRERRSRRLGWLGNDLRDGVRQLVRRPGFTALAVGTLALGLSTGTAVFTYVNAYARAVPGAEGRGLRQVYLSWENVPWDALSFPDFQDLAGALGPDVDVAGVGSTLFAASVRHEMLTEVAFGQGVTGSYFSVVGVEMALGRGVGPEDDRPGAEPAVVISHAWWGERYGFDPEVIGTTVLLNNEPHTIVGVAGPDFRGTMASYRPQYWLPFEQYMRVYWARSDRRASREAAAISPLLRVSDGGVEARVRTTLATLAEALDREAPLAERKRTYVLEPATWIGPATREAEAASTRIMLLAAASLLLLACANVANLVLSAGARRQREMALRSAMGASRGRLVRQVLAESMVLATLAGTLGLLAAGPIGARLSSYFARPSVWGANVPREIVVDPRVMLFALAAALVTGVVTGLVPALRAATRDPAAVLNAGGTWSSAGPRGWWTRIPGTRNLLVSAQVGLSVVLLFVAGLVLRTLDAASSVEAGFDTESTLASYVSTSSMGVPVAERHLFFEELVRRFEALPWVRSATVAEQAPLSPHPGADLRFDGAAEPVRATVARVWPGYFEVLGMEILRGRALLRTDTVDAAGVAVVNEALARRIAPGGEAVGRTLRVSGGEGAEERAYEVVGVARDARQTSFLEDPEPVAYFSLPQHYSAPGNALLVRVAGDPAAAVVTMERELRAVDTRIAIVNILPYRDVVRGYLYTQRMNAEMFGVIAALGLLLASAGVFGVVALAVARRRREIGIRIAVGAGRPSITGLVVATVSGPLLVGLAAGLAGALVAMRLVEGLLWGVEPADPLALTLGALALLAAIGLALAAPTLRALRVDPVQSLRTE